MKRHLYLEAAGRTGTGMTSGASRSAGRQRGLVHYWLKEEAQTSCGRTKGAGTILYPSPSAPGSAPDRMLTCPRCRDAVTN